MGKRKTYSSVLQPLLSGCAQVNTPHMLMQATLIKCTGRKARREQEGGKEACCQEGLGGREKGIREGNGGINYVL